jgi:hypothetical protein
MPRPAKESPRPCERPGAVIVEPSGMEQTVLQENRSSGNPDQPVERVARLARAEVRRARAVQCPIGYLVDSAFEESVISAEHAGWPKPLVLTPFVMS